MCIRDRCGVLALAGGKRPGKTILLRGDMDALPIQEESGEEFASEVPGKKMCIRDRCTPDHF